MTNWRVTVKKKTSKKKKKALSKNVVRIVVIDIGSNAIRSVLYFWTRQQGLKLAIKKRFAIRLGESVFKTKNISESSLRKSNQAFKQMQNFIQLHKPHHTVGVATSAVRDAKNKQDFVDLAKKYDLPINVISGQQEAEIIFHGILMNFKSFTKKIIALDLGGGSLEITIFNGKKITYSKSLQVGAVRALLNLKEKNLADYNSHYCLNEILSPALQDLKQRFNLDDYVVVATGGNAEALLKITGSQDKKINLKDLTVAQDSLNKTNLTTRTNKFQIRKDRADIALISTILFIKVLRALNKTEIFVPGLGLRQSLAMLIIKSNSGRPLPFA